MTISTFKNITNGNQVSVACDTNDDLEFCLSLRVAHLYGDSSIKDWKLVSCRKSDVGCF